MKITLEELNRVRLAWADLPESASVRERMDAYGRYITLSVAYKEQQSYCPTHDLFACWLAHA